MFGSKLLKGIVWHGEQKVEVARPDDFKAVVRDLVERSKDDPGAAAYQRGGTMNMVRIMNGANAFPTQYWRRGTLENFERITVETMLAEHGTRQRDVPAVHVQVRQAQHRVRGPAQGPRGRGPGVRDGVTCSAACAASTTSPRSCGSTTSATGSASTPCRPATWPRLAIECSQRGLIDEKLDWNDPDGVAAFLEKMCLREGIGDLWAEGILAVEKEYGLEGLAVHVKGMEPAGYDPRKMKGMGLGFATTTRGACHLRATMYKPELMGITAYGEVEGKAEIYCDWEDRLLIMDNLIYCRFYRDMVQWPYITAVVNAAIGTDYTEEDLHRIANRIITMTHDFNAARGIGRESERLPAWVTDDADAGRGRPHLPAGRHGLHARRVLPHPRLGRAAGGGAATVGRALQ